MAKLYASEAEFGVSFKFTTARPLDDRLVVDQATDIYDPATWGGADKCTLYTGLTVATSGGTLYTYTGPAGDADFAASLVAGKIPTENWKVQGGDTQAEVGNLADKVTKLETANTENKNAIAAVKATADKAVVANTAITKSTDFSVVKYDAKGLVTEGKVLTAAEVPGLSALETKVNKIGVTAKETANAGYLKSYTFTGPNGTPIDIDIPKDLVVKSGEVITATTETGLVKGDKYIKLTIADQDESPIYIAVKDLVDVYTAQADAEKVQLAISGTNEISATIKPGSIAKADLATDVRGSLDKADAAAPQTALDAANAEIVKIKADVAAHGVKSVTASGTGYVTAKATTDTKTGEATIAVASTPELATAVTAATSALQAGDVKADTGMLTLNVKGTPVTVPHGSMAEADADTYLTKDATNEAINAKAEEINGTINTTKADLEEKITALENAKLTKGAGISIKNNSIAVDKFAVTDTPTLSVDESNGVTYTNELVGATDKYVDSATLATIVNNTNNTVAKTVNALNTKVANASSAAAKKLDNIVVNGVTGTVAKSGELQISTVTLDATTIDYNNGTKVVKLSEQLDDILDTLQWTEVSVPQA